MKIRAPVGTGLSVTIAVVFVVTGAVVTSAGSKPAVSFVEFASGLTAPTDIATTASGRLYVTEQQGVIKIVEPDGSISATFLDIRDRVRSGGEEGLLGVALSPDFGSSGRFFVYYTRHDGNNQVSSFVGTGDHADPSSEMPILTLPHPAFTNHNGGDLAFGPDGFLYVATGDGGSAGDPNNNAQNPDSLLGKLLRLDVAGDAFPNDAARNYAIPGDNPFVNGSGADEVWVLGLRNPWRFSFDTETNNLFLSDVGQGAREEINFKEAGTPGGTNYGWRCYEGTAAFDLSGCSSQTAFTFPIAEYENTADRCAVTGGYVYRGDRYPQLRGDYFYMDFCSGELFSFKAHHKKGMAGPVRRVATFSDLRISSFGQDPDGEIYAADLAAGKIYRLEG